MRRLLVLCGHPHHLRGQDAQAWLRRELEAVLRRDDLESAKLTRLGSPSVHSATPSGWLVEFRAAAGPASKALERGGACGELIADLRLLGMAPLVVLADDRDAVELRPS